jgi:hypothetical protein
VIYGLNASVPHRYGYVCQEVLYGLDPARVGHFEPCVVFGVTSIPSRALHFSILCESGAQWARIPLHMLRHEVPEPSAALHPLSELQTWDSLGYEFGLTQYQFLREMGCRWRRTDGTWVPASYWFTIDHVNNGWSDYPPEHKCYHVLLCEDGTGQIAAQPNNRVLWSDPSFVQPGHPLDYRVMGEATWHAEHRPESPHVNPQDTAFTQDERRG